MKIVHLARLYSPHIGGVEIHLQHLNRIWIQQGHQVSVLTEQSEASSPLNQKIEGVSVQRIPISATHSKLGIWISLWAWRQQLLTADIIHIHDVFFWLLPLLPFLPRKKIFITFHGYEGTEPPNWKQKFWHQLAALMTAGNICVGDFHRRWYGVTPTLVTYGAVQTVTTKKTKTSPNKTLTKIIYLGRLAADSGILIYLEAIKIAQAQGLRLQLDVFGDGPDRRIAEAYCREQQLSVTFYGEVKNAAEKLSNYHVAFVSRYLSILESLAAGVQVIAHYNNDIKYDYLSLAPYAQWIKIAHQPVEIVDQLQKLTTSSIGIEQLIQAQKWAREQTWEKLAKQYAQMWEGQRG